MARTRKRKDLRRSTKFAFAYAALKPKLDRAFDAWAAAKPEDADTLAQQYYALVDQMHRLGGNRP